MVQELRGLGPVNGLREESINSLRTAAEIAAGPLPYPLPQTDNLQRIKLGDEPTQTEINAQAADSNVFFGGNLEAQKRAYDLENSLGEASSVSGKDFGGTSGTSEEKKKEREQQAFNAILNQIAAINAELAEITEELKEIDKQLATLKEERQTLILDHEKLAKTQAEIESNIAVTEQEIVALTAQHEEAFVAVEEIKNDLNKNKTEELALAQEAEDAKIITLEVQNNESDSAQTCVVHEDENGYFVCPDGKGNQYIEDTSRLALIQNQKMQGYGLGNQDHRISRALEVCHARETTLKDRLAHAEENLSKIEQELDAKKESLKADEQKIIDLDNDIKEIEKKLENNQGSIDALELRKGKLLERQQELQQQKDALLQEHDSPELRAYMEQSGEYEALQDKLDGLKTAEAGAETMASADSLLGDIENYASEYFADLDLGSLAKYVIHCGPLVGAGVAAATALMGGHEDSAETSTTLPIQDHFETAALTPAHYNRDLALVQEQVKNQIEGGAIYRAKLDEILEHRPELREKILAELEKNNVKITEPENHLTNAPHIFGGDGFKQHIPDALNDPHSIIRNERTVTAAPELDKDNAIANASPAFASAAEGAAPETLEPLKPKTPEQEIVYNAGGPGGVI